MISASDIIRLPYTSDLTRAGIAYAIKSLPHTYDRMGGTNLDTLRRIVAGVAVELSFIRYLNQQQIPYDLKGATPFTDPDRYDVSLGKHPCDIKSFLIMQRRKISTMRADPSALLDAPALVPMDQHRAGEHSGNDLYLFVFLAALLATSPPDVERVIKRGLSVTMLYSMPEPWVRPRNWHLMSPIALKSEAENSITIELAGQNEARDIITRKIELPPRKRVVVEDAFFSLSSISSDQPLTARLGVHSSSMDLKQIIQVYDWGNIHVYGIEILLAGYITRQDFGASAGIVPAGSKVFQYDRTRTKNMAVPVAKLHPLGSLFERLKAWDAAQGKGIIRF